MSYILDALKKAAEQRGEGAPGYRRVVAAPATPVDNRRTWTRMVGVVLCAVAAGAVMFAAFRPAPVVTVVVAPSPAVVPRAPAEAPRSPAPVSAPPRVVAPIVTVPRAPAPPPRVVPATRPAVVAIAPRPDPPAAAVTPLPVPSAPSGPSAPVPAAVADAKLKLEVLVYSDVASERMVFINGRKYLQGDTVAERARVEEIQQDGVVLSEHGRRFTLRQ